MKKGFTLIELLAVIVIIRVVALIAVPSIMSNITESREKLYKVQVQNIELAAKKWATDSSDELDNNYLNSSFVSIEMLQDLGYLSKDKINNPNTSEAMNGCVEVAYDAASKIYTYNYDDDNTGCLVTDNKGFYYTKTNGTWNRDLSNQRQSIYSYLVGEDGANIVVSGSGLYDMEDRYVFRGNVLNNYVKLDGAYFRILSLDKTTKTMKLISMENSGSAVWGAQEGNTSFNVSTLYTQSVNKSLYPTITNVNVNWNIGKVETTSELNLNAVRTYEGKTKIVSEIGLVSMSEYMEASTNIDCSNGVLASCASDNYLDMADSWTTTTTNTSVVYIDATKGLSYETDLTNAHHYIYRALNVITMEKHGTGSYSDPFIISTTES